MSQKKGIYRSLKRRYKLLQNERRYLEIIRRGEYAVPPHSIKLEVLKRNLPSPRPQIFIETGTYLGETVAAMKGFYAEVISIEVSDILYSQACERFKNDANVRIFHGDCIGELPKILSGLKESAAFWLDGHFSGEGTGKGEIEDPILISLDQIACHPIKEHVIFVDDARTFDGREGRPDISEVMLRIKKVNNRYILRIQNDIIIATVTPFAVHN